MNVSHWVRSGNLEVKGNYCCQRQRSLFTAAFLVQCVLSHGMAIAWEAMKREWKNIASLNGGLSAGASKADQADPNS